MAVIQLVQHPHEYTGVTFVGFCAYDELGRTAGDDFTFTTQTGLDARYVAISRYAFLK